MGDYLDTGRYYNIKFFLKFCNNNEISQLEGSNMVTFNGEKCYFLRK